MSLFGASAFVNDEFKKRLVGFKTSKGTIQFTVEKPLPATLVKMIVKMRMKENEEKAKARAERKKSK
ncbi:hypothetical protein IT157_07960 [bacterium]|nr:hypothetical protein [bacterium]